MYARTLSSRKFIFVLSLASHQGFSATIHKCSRCHTACYMRARVQFECVRRKVVRRSLIYDCFIIEICVYSVIVDRIWSNFLPVVFIHCALSQQHHIFVAHESKNKCQQKGAQGRVFRHIYTHAPHINKP